MSVPTTPLLDLTRWGFLSTPLDELLGKLNARIVEIPTDEECFRGGYIEREGSLVIVLPRSLGALEKDLSTRGLLATWCRVETSDWPTGATFSDLEELA